MQGYGYTLRNGGVTISTAITALQLKAGTNGPVKILRYWAMQQGNTTSGQPSIALIRKTAAATVTIAVAGTNVTKLNPANPTSDLSLGTSATGFTASGEGTDGEIVDSAGFNCLNGREVIFTPEEQVIVPQGGIIAIKFLDAPASAKWYCGIRFIELRGG
jgi:hypothetical protein